MTIPVCLSVIVPCYNEERTINRILSRILAQPSVGEVIIIDDFSADNSVQFIEAFEDSRIILIKNTKNLGKGACVSKGITTSTYPFVVIQDADLEYSPEEFPRLLAPLLDGRADAVLGSRFLTYEARRALY